MSSTGGALRLLVLTNRLPLPPTVEPSRSVLLSEVAASDPLRMRGEGLEALETFAVLREELAGPVCDILTTAPKKYKPP